MLGTTGETDIKSGPVAPSDMSRPSSIRREAPERIVRIVRNHPFAMLQRFEVKRRAQTRERYVLR